MAIRSCTTADLVYDEVAAPHRRVEGIDQVIAMWQEGTIAFPDIYGTFVNSYVSGTNVVCDEVIGRGTHTGPLQTPDGVIPATGKSFEIRSCRVVEIEGDKVKVIRNYFDGLTMMQQLGLAG